MYAMGMAATWWPIILIAMFFLGKELFRAICYLSYGVLALSFIILKYTIIGGYKLSKYLYKKNQNWHPTEPVF